MMPYRRRHPHPDLSRFLVVLFFTSELFGLLLLAALGSCQAWAHNPDQPHAAWFNSLKQPGSNAGCCSLADCKDEPYRQTPTGYDVQIDGEWVEVPPEKILEKIENPTGHAVTCHIGKMIFCFVRETES